MGEGWSDFYALALLSEPGDDVNGSYPAGGYATYLVSGLTANYYFGIRRYPYSTDMTKNPLTFKDIDSALASPHSGIPRSPIIGNTPSSVHNQGEVWCVALWEARAGLINKYGWEVGNQMILQLVTDGMRLTPPTPNFLEARDAIFQADLVNNGGANHNELWTAFAKRGMGYSATAPDSSSNSGISEAFDVPDDLVIAPAPVLSCVGGIGGPFTPNPASFILTNTGTSPLSWSLLSTSSWINVVPVGGVLLPGGSAVTVNATILPSANLFPPGIFTTRIWFTNHNSGVVQSHAVELSISGLRISDDFDPDLDLSQWSAFGGDVGSTVRATNYGGHVSSPNALWFGGSEVRYAKTMPVDTRGGGTVSFALRMGSGLDFPWETVDLPGEGVVLESSTDGGVTWVGLGDYESATYYDWTSESFPIPEVAQATATNFRWRQKSHSGGSFDHWALDDVMIHAVAPPILRLTLPVASVEGEPFVTGTVTTSPVPLKDTVVHLDSNDQSEIVPASPVVILAGQTNANFILNIVDDVEFDGPQTVSITASAEGFQNELGTMVIEDDEVATLSISLPSDTTEGTPNINGVVSLDVIPSANIVVEMSSSDATAIQVPPTVVIAAGQTSTLFSVTVVNDSRIDGSQIAGVTAHVARWIAGMATITVYDNETVNLALSLPVSAYENVGVLAGAGRVAIAGTLLTNLVVSLLSSDSTEATMPAVITIPSGQTNAAFDLTMVDDPFADKARPVQIVASAPGFNSVSNYMSVLDDESPPLPTNPSPANLASNVPANISLAWSNGVAGVTNDVYFGTIPGSGQLQYLGSTTGSNWSMPLLSPNTTYYWRLVVHRTGSTIGPVWRFTTRGVDHFDVSTIASPQFVNRSFPVTVTARDEFNSVVSNFNATVGFSGVGPSGPMVMFSDDFEDGEISDWVEGTGSYVRAVTNDTASDGGMSLTLIGGSESHFDGISQSLSNLSPDRVEFFVRAGATNASAGWVAVGQDSTRLAGSSCFDSTGLMNFGGIPSGAQPSFNAGQWYKIAFVYDWTNRTVSYYRDAVLIQANVPFGDNSVSGLSVIYLYNYDPAKAWWDEIRFTGGNLASTLSITPTNLGVFTDGRWTGDTTVLQLSDGMHLRAADDQGHSGISPQFAVSAFNDLVLSMSATPNPDVLRQLVTNTIVVGNSGPDAATGVFVTNFLPAEVLFVTATTSAGHYSVAGNVVTFDLGILNADQTATMTVVTEPLSGGNLTNVAVVSRTEVDGFESNNTAQTTTLVIVPVMTIHDSARIEGHSGTSDMVFNLNLWPAPAVTASVTVATSDGTGLAGSDYVATTGVVSFAPGQTNAVINVHILGDTSVELVETFLVVLSNPTNCLIGMSTAAGTILDDDAPVVAVYDDPLYVDTISGGVAAESDNLQASLTSLGFTVVTFSDLLELTNHPCAQFPEMENGSLGPALTLVERSAISNFVAQGGTLLINGTGGGQAAMLLNTVFDWSLVENDTSADSLLTAQAMSTQFADDPTTLPSPSATTALVTNSLPVGALSIYESGGMSAVAVIGWGRGLVVFLGWDWYDAVPLGSRDDGWLAVLNSAAQQRAVAPAPAIMTQPADTNIYVGEDASFSVVVSGWTPMSYQWKREGVSLPYATNQTLSLEGVNANAAGGYAVTVTNAYGSVTSSKAFLSVLQPEIINPAPITVIDGSPASPYPSTITVSGLTGAVVKVTVSLRSLTHSFPDDLDVLLVGPGGDNVLLMSDVGGHADMTAVTLVFDDQAGLSLPDEDQLSPGSYRPTNYGNGDVLPAPAPVGGYGTNLSVFNGSNPNGLWRLFVYDDEAGDAGSIEGGWSLRIAAASPGVPEFLPAKLVGGQIQLRFTTSPGQSYTVQYKNSLTDLNWENLRTITGDGGVRTVSDPVNLADTRFYRIRMP